MTEMPRPVKLPPFKAWLASNIPAVYDNTMSYYDELTSLIAWLEKEVVPNVNEAIVLANTLKDFVENYFKNLDVQEEINNKLDQMAEDGTLQEIITTYIQSNVAWTFDTVADMKLATNLIAGSYARTLGFHSINDGGGATYYITDTGTANEMNIIAIGNLYANLIYGKQIDVKQLGAYADDIHNDSEIINYAMTLVYDIVLPKGTYLCENTINIGGDLDNNYHFNCKGIIHTTATTGILLVGSYNKIFIDKIIGRSVEKDNNLFVISTSESHNVSGYNWIEIGQGRDCNNVIILKPTQGGISYNEIKFINIYATNACILFQCDDINSSYVTENHFTGGRVGGGTGVKMVKGAAQVYNYGGNLFDHIGFEGLTCGVHLEFAQKNNFMHSRMSESLTGDYWIECDADSYFNKFNAETLAIDKINDLNNTSGTYWNGYNEYSGDRLNIDGRPVANYVRVINNKVYADSQFEFFARLNMVSTYGTVNATVNADYYYNSMTIEVGGDEVDDYVVNLDDALPYGGVTDFYIFVKNLPAGATLKLHRGNADIIKANCFGSAGMSNRIYHIVKSNYNTYFGTSWSVTGSFEKP